MGIRIRLCKNLCEKCVIFDARTHQYARTHQADGNTHMRERIKMAKNGLFLPLFGGILGVFGLFFEALMGIPIFSYFSLFDFNCIKINSK